MITIEEELQRLIVVEKRDNETVFDWIESNVDEPTTRRSKFIRALMTCVCNAAFTGNASVKQELYRMEVNWNEIRLKTSCTTYLNRQF